MRRHTRIIIATFLAVLLYGGIRYLPTAFEHMRGAAAQHNAILSKV